MALPLNFTLRSWFFWDKILLCSFCWLWTHNSPATGPWVLKLQVSTTIPVLPSIGGFLLIGDTAAQSGGYLGNVLPSVVNPYWPAGMLQGVCGRAWVWVWLVDLGPTRQEGFQSCFHGSLSAQGNEWMVKKGFLGSSAFWWPWMRCAFQS